MSEHPHGKIVMVEAKNNWISKLMSRICEVKYIEICQGKSFRNNEQTFALADLIELASRRALQDLPVDYDEWFGC